VRVVVAAGLLILGTAWLWRHLADRAWTRVTVIPLNGGTAIYCSGPADREDLLIDCGNESAAQFVMKPFLRSRGVTTLDRLLLTHGKVHNVGGAEFIREQFHVRRVLLGPASFRSAAYREIQADLSRIPGLTRTVRRGDHLGPWEVLHPEDQDRFPQADD